jgi:predicted transcriptional regulator
MVDRKALRAAAKVLYDAGRQTVKQIASEIGTSSRTVERWASADGWNRVKVTPELSGKVHRVASRLAEIPDNAPQEERQKVMETVTENEAVTQRAEVISRHRQEWRIVRLLICESVKNRDIERGKLAEILARATKISQDGERRAWAIDSGDEGNRVTVVIERE